LKWLNISYSIRKKGKTFNGKRIKQLKNVWS
jgi:hypothetical protein